MSPITNGIEGFEFETPTAMLQFIDDDILNGTIQLYPWQLKLHYDFSRNHTASNPFQCVARTNNSAGKDQIIIAPCATWLAARFPYTTCVITTASGQQLDRQTSPAIDRICQQTNAKLGQEVWKCNYRHYENLVTKSTIEMFVTDESGRAEGWHPAVPNAKLAIFASEAKSVPEEIFKALTRCGGFTHRVFCSTPGLPLGTFFNKCSSNVDYRFRNGHIVTEPENFKWKQYHVTAYDCPHISKSEIDQAIEDCGGDNTALFKSMMLAEFCTTDDMVVIPYHRIWTAIYEQKIGHIPEPHNTGGLDLSAGGDETVLSVRNGNKLLKIFAWRIEDTSKSVDHIERLFKDNGLQHPDALIFADVGGLGNPILWDLKSKRGWHNIRFVDNRNNAVNKRAYFNKGTEMWFNFGSLLEKNEILLFEDKKLREQLAARYYKMREASGNYILESKLQARAAGHPSPDRADSVILAFSNYKSKLVDEPVKDDKRPIPARPAFKRQSSGLLMKDLASRSGKEVNLSTYAGTRGIVQDDNRIENRLAEYNLTIKKD